MKDRGRLGRLKKRKPWKKEFSCWDRLPWQQKSIKSVQLFHIIRDFGVFLQRLHGFRFPPPVTVGDILREICYTWQRTTWNEFQFFCMFHVLEYFYISGDSTLKYYSALLSECWPWPLTFFCGRKDSRHKKKNCISKLCFVVVVLVYVGVLHENHFVYSCNL